MGFRAIGLDRSEPLALIARRHANVPVVVGDFCSLPFANGSLGGAWAAASLLHLPRSEIVVALSEAYRVLAPRSVLFLSLKRGLGETRDATGRWFTLVEPKELRAALKAAGFYIFDMEVERKKSMEADSWGGQWITCLAGRP
jgi:SAM-dependent methyltransferase